MKKKQAVNKNEVENSEEIIVGKIEPYAVQAYKVLAYTDEELEMLARGEKVLTAEEMEEQEILAEKKRRNKKFS